MDSFLSKHRDKFLCKKRKGSHTIKLVRIPSTSRMIYDFAQIPGGWIAGEAAFVSRSLTVLNSCNEYTPSIIETLPKATRIVTCVCTVAVAPFGFVAFGSAKRIN